MFWYLYLVCCIVLSLIDVTFIYLKWLIYDLRCVMNLTTLFISLWAVLIRSLRLALSSGLLLLWISWLSFMTVLANTPLTMNMLLLIWLVHKILVISKGSLMMMIMARIILSLWLLLLLLIRSITLCVINHCLILLTHLIILVSLYHWIIILIMDITLIWYWNSILWGRVN